MLDHGIIIDGIKWVIGQHPKRAIPLCPTDFIKLTPVEIFDVTRLKCEECNKFYNLPREYSIECTYVLDKLNAKIFRKMKFINLDDESIPIAENKKASKDNRFFITSLLTESKMGKRLIIYAGEKGRKEKTQIFVEPEIKRLAFDQKDLHPTDVFTKLEATFSDGTKSEMKKE